MASQPSDDGESREKVSKGVERTSKIVEAVSSFVDDDHIAEVMRVQQSV